MFCFRFSTDIFCVYCDIYSFVLSLDWIGFVVLFLSSMGGDVDFFDFLFFGILAVWVFTYFGFLFYNPCALL